MLLHITNGLRKEFFKNPSYLKLKYKAGEGVFVKAAYGRAIMDGSMSVEKALDLGNKAYLEHLESINMLQEVTYGEAPGQRLF